MSTASIYDMQDFQHIDRILRSANLPPLRQLAAIGGGCINRSYCCELQDGRRLFAKLKADAPDDFFAAEAKGLAAMSAKTALRVPRVMHHDKQCLLQEYLAPAPITDDYWQQLGSGLADMHRCPEAAFGFSDDNYCGATPQPNPRCDNGYQFFAEQRLLYQADLATERELLAPGDRRRIETLCLRLPQLLPDESPRLLHGDLWRGNIHGDERGLPVLIDPACYWGWREADIAMTQLFGQLPASFYDSYQEALPLQSGWQERVDVYNLYHLLNHLNLFGNSYLGSVQAVLARFVG